jgi:hypothetical protein
VAKRNCRRTLGEYPSVLRPRRSSRGEKDDPTGRAAEANAAKEDLLAARNGQGACRQGLLGVVLPLGRLPAVGTGDGLAPRGLGGGVGVDLVLQEFELEGLGEVIGPPLALIEGDQILVVGEHEVESLGSPLQELLTKLVAGRTGGTDHRGNSDPWGNGSDFPYPNPELPSQLRGCTRDGGVR